jgi:hydrogenase nickel incorporation protein HypB
MISRELGESVKENTDLLVIENVGNLVCPAAFDLGEEKKIALLSTTEGEDKPSKYPVLFHSASVIIITKIDLIPHLDWSLEKCIYHIRKINPTSPIIKVSAKTGEGMHKWINFLNALWE